MNVMITYKQMSSSPSLDAKIHEKSEKLKKYFDKDIHVKWTCSVGAEGHFSEAEVTGHGGTPLFASASSDNLYKTLDEVVQKIGRQARKRLTRENQKNSNLEFEDQIGAV